ncbi:MAG TPA: SRPBCC domain-containing protein [Nocardioides sp.]|jgi:uncharacterized protein YndB with AHSA1/START domain
MEYGTLERELHIDASPEVVFEVISSPAHIKEWWGAETDLAPTAGATGALSWGEGTDEEMVVPITVVDAVPPRLFSFRWTQPDGEVAEVGNSLLVTFELVPSGEGTTLRLTETGFREMGWEIAVLEEQYHEHVVGWDKFVPAIGKCAERLVSRP